VGPNRRAHERGRAAAQAAKEVERAGRKNRQLDYKERFILAARTQRWAVTMTKVAIRQALSCAPFPRWHFVSFTGPEGKESRGVVDLIAIRKDHGISGEIMKRGDALEIILIQVKGGYAARPTAEDGERLRAVARQHGARAVLLASWKKGKAARFFSLRSKQSMRKVDWAEVSDLTTIFLTDRPGRRYRASV
jgi:hypothetical protein